jgi:hypothetical protein
LLPQTGDKPSISTQKRRRWDRHKISVLITLRHDHSPLPLRVTATDISASGCYVETLSPFQIGTSLTAEWSFGSQKVMTRTFVRSCDPQVGMGIEFMGLRPEEAQGFQAYLQAMNPWACSIEQTRKPH